MSTANQFQQVFPGHSCPLSYQFGPFVLDTLQHALLRKGKPIALAPKTYDTLLLLVQNRGRMLSKGELMKALWPDSFVEESNLTQQVSMIRRALGDSASAPCYIVTVPSRGYRFVAEVLNWPEETLGLDLLEPAMESDAGEAKPRSGIPSRPEHLGKKDGPTPRLLTAPQREHRRTEQSVTVMAVLAALLFLAVLAIGRSLYQRWPQTAHLQAKPRSLAILPLQNLKQDPADDFLGFSLADAVITKLDYVSSLSVRPSAAVQPYRNQVINIQKVAADLNVDTLLTGSFIHDRDRLRITYQLIDSKANKILSRGTIDLKYEDLLKVQDNVSQRIIKDLELNLSPSEAERIKLDAPVNPLAYEYYLHGVDLYSRGDFETAIEMLEKCTQIDPNYALSWAQLGRAYNASASFQFGGRDYYRRAQAAFEKALYLQPAQIEVRIYMANFLTDTGEVEQSVPLLRDALKTNPNEAEVHWELGYAYRFAGMLEESAAECERARALDPGVKLNSSALNAYLYLGQYDRFLASLPTNDVAFIFFYRGFGEYYRNNRLASAKNFDHAFELDPSLLQAQIGKAISDRIHGQSARGIERLRETEKRIIERGVRDPEADYKIAQAYAVLGEKNSALQVLKRSVEGGFFSYPYLASDPLLDAVRKEGEFAKILNAARARHEAFRGRFF